MRAHRAIRAYIVRTPPTGSCTVSERSHETSRGNSVCNGRMMLDRTDRADDRNCQIVDKPASPASRVRPSSLTTSMADMRTFANAFERLGHDVDGLLADVGFSRRDLNDPDRRIACDIVGSLISQAQQKRFTPNLGLAMALATPLGAYPLLDYLILTSDTVGDGLAQLARYLCITASPVSVDLHADGDPVRVEIETVSTFGYEFEAALIVLRFREETDGVFGAAGISFQHQPDDAAAFERALGCPVWSRASWNGVAIDRSTCRLPMRRRDPILRKFLESQADAILASMPARTGVAMDVRRALASRIAAGNTRMSSIARQLGMSERTCTDGWPRTACRIRTYWRRYGKPPPAGISMSPRSRLVRLRTCWDTPNRLRSIEPSSDGTRRLRNTSARALADEDATRPGAWRETGDPCRVRRHAWT
jgi:Arabinose-binding domain of AraC transcription regulator, N-term